eukprot:TRINITY_DN3685_c1_g1_i1.p1 TRINITY_DN3685_c1_g1~~TRINITY_DN3685_c1_g1_i1.p1  ORF type:complete len:445 (-),score=74.54 TRINITY_DN3685_c1_g1_i1:134-1468(-)
MLPQDKHAYTAVPQLPTELQPLNGGTETKPQWKKLDEHRENDAARQSALSRLGAAKLFYKFYEDDTTNVETNSVYGSAMVIPQLGRSAGWPMNLILAAFRSYVFLALNVVVQGMFLYMINKEENVLSAFAGQMFLCDLGAGSSRCPEGAGCLGPGGTFITPPRLYPFDQWVTRIFVKDSLKAIFPEREHQIDEFVDPGEYGVESYSCRLICCFVFMVSLTTELDGIRRMIILLYTLPTEHESWITYDPAVSSEVELKLAGMPTHWKAVNVIFIVVPKLMLWKLTCQAGILFLLETSGIIDVIANSVALGFILSIDELLFENLSTADTKDLMGMLQGFNVKTLDYDPSLSEEETLEKDYNERQNVFFLTSAIPIRLLQVVILTTAFVLEYYLTHCNLDPGTGSWVPDPLYLPKTDEYSLLDFIFPSIFKLAYEDAPAWEMPARES